MKHFNLNRLLILLFVASLCSYLFQFVPLIVYIKHDELKKQLKEAESTIRFLLDERDGMKLKGETKCNQDFPQHMEDTRTTQEEDKLGQVEDAPSDALMDVDMSGTEVSLDKAPFKEKKYCFIHVGKSAGSKVSCELGYRYAPYCRQSLYPEDNVLVRNRKGFVHMRTEHSDCTSADMFLVATRNPIDRLISWFHYERKKGILSYDRETNEISYFSNGNTEETCLKKLHTTEEWGKGCFSNVDEFAIACIPGAEEGSCSKLAWDAVQGAIGCEVHNFFNYNFYKNKMDEITEKKKIMNPISSNLSVAVLRQEYLVEDFYNLHVMFGDEKVKSFENFAEKNVLLSLRINNTPANNAYISEEGRHNLCRALSNEMEVYKNLILSAENLSVIQKEESLQKMYESCPRKILEEDV